MNAVEIAVDAVGGQTAAAKIVVYPGSRPQVG